MSNTGLNGTGDMLGYGPALPLAAQAWRQAKAGARASSSIADPLRLLADGMWVADALVVLVAAAVANLLRQGFTPIPLEVFSTALLAAVLTVNAMHMSGAYGGTLNEAIAAQVGQAVRAGARGVAILLILGYLTKTSEIYSRLWIISWYGVALFGFASLRAWSISQTKRWQRQGRLARTVAIIELGEGGKGRELVRRLQALNPGAFHLVGLFSEERTDSQRNGIKDLIALEQ